MMKLFSCVGACGRQVDYLDLKHCSLNSVPIEVIRNVKSLEELHLDSNNITELPKNLFKLEKIRYLSISDNSISEIPVAIGNCKTLLELDASRNELTELPGTLRFLNNLISLDVSSNSIQHLPDGFCELVNLKFLILNNIALVSLPQDFGKLVNLQKLELRDNSLKSLPQTFENLSALEFLDLGGNDFHVLPPLIEKLSNLTELWLDENDIKTLPREIGKLVKLQQLDISENRLDSLPEEISGLVSLMDLNIEKNKIESLPSGIGCLQKLSVLKMDKNNLSQLTPQIGECSSLQELSIKESSLSHLPNTIGKLKSLFHLNVDCNKLVDLPAELGDCKSMQILSLRDNLITRLIPEIGSLVNLHVLDLAGNRLKYLPEELSRCPLTALWLSENQAQSIVPLQNETDPKSGQVYLTNYMLPQVPSSLSTDDEKAVNDPDPNHTSLLERESRVRFDAPESGDHTNNSDFPKTVFPKKDSQISDKIQPSKETVQLPLDEDHHDATTTTKNHFEEPPNVSIFDRHEIQPIDATLNDYDDQIPSLDTSSVRLNGDGSVNKQISLNSYDTKELTHPKSIDLNNYSTTIYDGSSNEGEMNISRNVIFGEDVVDNEERNDSKLIRRDTPHYTKRSRISQKPIDGHENMEEFLKVLKPEQKEKFLKIQEETSHFTQLPITIVKKDGYGLGLSIAGGVGSVPYCRQDNGIFVSRLVPNGLAAQSGLRVGDKIISVDSDNMINVEHNVAVSALRKSEDVIKLVVSREVRTSFPAINNNNSESNFQIIDCTLKKSSNEFGFMIASKSDNPNNIFISDITPKGSADQSGLVSLGDQLIRINDLDVKNLTINQVFQVLYDSPTQVHLQLIRNPGLKFKTHNEVLDYHSSRLTPTALPSVPARTMKYNMLSNPAIDRVVIHKSDNHLGLSLCGGIDHDCYPYNGGGEPGLFVSKLTPAGTAFQSGLRVGNQIVSCNGRDLRGMTHNEAIDAITSNLSDVLVFEVYRYPTPDSLKEITLMKNMGSLPIGLNIIGNTESAGGRKASLFGKTDQGIYIHSVLPNSLAAMDGRLKSGDRILDINGSWLSGALVKDVIDLMHESSELKLLICSGKSDSVKAINNTSINSQWVHNVDSFPTKNSPMIFDLPRISKSPLERQLLSPPSPVQSDHLSSNNDSSLHKKSDYFSSVQVRIQHLENFNSQKTK